MTAQQAAPAAATPRGGIHPGIKIGFLICAISLVAALVALKLREYVLYLDFATLAVMDPQPMDRAAPDFDLVLGESAQHIRLAELKGGYALVHFWATWCPPCRQELASIEYLARRLGDQLRVVAITVDDKYEDVNAFLGEQKPTFTLAWDKDRVAAQAYGTRKYPETYLVDPRGRIVAKFVGARDWNSKAAKHYFDEILSDERGSGS